MNSYYYSQLDLINKYNFSNILNVNQILNHVEISFKKLEKEEIEGKNIDIELLSFFYSFFSRSPKITIKNVYDSGKLSREIQKRIQVYNKKNVTEILNYLIRDCHVSNDNLKLVKREKGTFSVVYEIKLAYKKHSLQLPNSLLRRAGNELPTLKVEFFFNKCNVNLLADIFPFWQLSHLDLVKKQLH